MPKRRLSLTLDAEVLRKLDFYTASSSISSRSMAVEKLLKNALASKAPRKAVILCGGKGTRMRPFTYEMPKPMLPVRGRPIIEHQIDLLKKHGITEIILSVGHLKDKIKEHFKDGSRLGVDIKYVEEDSPLGTAGPLRLCKDMLNETFIMTNGDELKDINISDMMLKAHKQNNALATIALTTVEDPSAYGVARLSGSRILEFVEKPKKENAPSNLINSGFYIIEPEVIDMVPKGFSLLEKRVFPQLAKKGRLFGYPFSGQWFAVGTPEQYEIAIKNWKGVQ